MSESIFYFDDAAIGLSRETSHPNYNALLVKDFYFDSEDVFSPFGNGDGSETLAELEEWYAETAGKGDIMDFVVERMNDYGHSYNSMLLSVTITPEHIDKLMDEDEFLLPYIDDVIIATAFGQYKIAGIIDAPLKRLAEVALQREEIIHRGIIANGTDTKIKFLEAKESPARADAEIIHSRKFLSRLMIMRADLERFEERESNSPTA